jgi:hypothetical protein
MGAYPSQSSLAQRRKSAELRSCAVKKGDRVVKDGWSIIHDSAQPYRVTSVQASAN